jgi:preprotein translocase subunit YajC
MLEAIRSFLAPEAWAMAPSPEGGGAAGLMGLLPLVLIFVIFYFLLIRPQQRKQKEHQAMLASVKKGDKVVTSGGIYGLVEQVGNKTITLKIADNVKVKIGKAYVAAVRSTSEEE